MRVIAFIIDPSMIRDILLHLPDAGAAGFDPHAQPAAEYEFDQRIAW